MTSYRKARDRILAELDASDPNWDMKYNSEYEAAEALGLTDLLREMEYADDEEIEELDFDSDPSEEELRWWEEQNADREVDE